NYFSTKSDLLWSAFDATFAALPDVFIRCRAENTDGKVRVALAELAASLPPENVALAYGQAEQMGLQEELRQAASLRISTVGEMITEFARNAGIEPLRAGVGGYAYAGALIAAIAQWSRAGAARTSLTDVLAEAWEPLEGLL